MISYSIKRLAFRHLYPEIRALGFEEHLSYLRLVYHKASDKPRLFKAMWAVYRRARKNLPEEIAFKRLMKVMREEINDPAFQHLLGLLDKAYIGQDFTEWFIEHYFEFEGDWKSLWDDACVPGKAQLLLGLRIGNYELLEEAMLLYDEEPLEQLVDSYNFEKDVLPVLKVGL